MKNEQFIFADLNELSLEVSDLGIYWIFCQPSDIFNEERRKELDLSLCSFNYNRLAGLQSPETRGEAAASGPAATPPSAQYPPKYL